VARLPPEPPTDPATSLPHASLGADEAGRALSPQPSPQPSRRELFVRSGPAAGLRFALRDGVITVGRSSQSDCPLHDEAVSRRHFELAVAEGAVHLRDLGSGNGTRVNGRRVEVAQLRHGDSIVAGNSTLEFLETPAESGAGRDPLASRDEPRRGQWLGVSVVVASLVVAALVSMVALHRRQAQQRIAEQAFARGVAELSEDPPDPELALGDFSAAQRDLPDQRALRDAIAEARDVAASIQRLSRARELSDQKSFADARRQLQGLPASPYFDRMALSISEELDRREAAQLAAELSGPRPPVPVIRAIGRAIGRAPAPVLAPAPAASGSPSRGKKPHRASVTPPDDDRAEQLCDDADALLGPNPEAAHRKYREALKVARPGSAAARRAAGGLEN